MTLAEKILAARCGLRDTDRHSCLKPDTNAVYRRKYELVWGSTPALWAEVRCASPSPTGILSAEWAAGKDMELSPEEMAEHVMEGADPAFVSRIKEGDILAAGDNFGSGSSRETAPLALKLSGVGAVIAKSFFQNFLSECDESGAPGAGA